MTRFLMGFAAGALTLVVLAGGAAALFASGVIRPRLAEAAAAPWMRQLPPELQGLQALPPEQRFGHFLGGQMRFTDANNATHSVTVAPGTVAAISSDNAKLTL